jgi:hypothetical protein
MVILGERTHFGSRYETGKRAMTLSEIREAFTADLLNRRLIAIQQAITELRRAEDVQRRREVLAEIEAGGIVARLNVADGRELMEIDVERFRIAVQNRPAFYLSTTPDVPRPRLVDVDLSETRRIFSHGFGSRPTGWNVTHRLAEIERFAEGVRYRGSGLESGRLELLENGHMSYAQFLGESFYWRQSQEEWEQRPRLWPVAVIEYTLSFLRLYGGICDLFQLSGRFHLHVEYRNVARHALSGGQPTWWGSFGLFEPQSFDGQHLYFSTPVDLDDLAEAAAFDAIRRTYAAFGYSQDAIPFWSRETQRFEIPTGG